ncbi:OprO/OprP family phosphate-selective porin [Novosphingobium sp. Gsoil 351]|uniref:OprO/OprP family phosphate-selective porin n=1 Tax=Novosphingobium sp. Gsoil 351 TaxID=2675225 RepID=UPI0012B4CED6|nr:porin [Novosphingobium sp. Gsoil 351]QGN53685.1 porin [Novosphingobium sp. Gsoil 351]
MIRTRTVSGLALTIALGWAVPATAQSAADFARMKAQMDAMQVQLDAMKSKVDTLESQLTKAQAEAQSATVAAQSASASAAQASEVATKTAAAAPKVAWKGAPEFTGPDGFSFKPRGRLQLDTGGVDGPRGIGSTSLGYATELRRAFLGFEGTLPGKFGYRAEIDVANSGVEITDLFLTYKPKPEITLTLGQHKPFWGLEELTSDLMTSFMERGAFNSAFGFERRVGASAAYAGKTLLVQGGVFADNAADLNNDTNNSYSVDGRVVFMPKLGGGQLHIGGSLHHREFNDIATTARYRARPFVHTTDLRLVDTKAFSADGETSYGAELAYIAGRFHATGEGHWLTAHRPGLSDPTFFGAYAEVGYMLTDDETVYKGGVYDRIKPKKPVGKGGIGALQFNARYDLLDLSDGAVVGGRQQIAGASLLWIPTDYVRFILNYGHIWIDDAAVAAAGDRNYSADAVGMRAQFDF